MRALNSVFSPQNASKFVFIVAVLFIENSVKVICNTQQQKFEKVLI